MGPDCEQLIRFSGTKIAQNLIDFCPCLTKQEAQMQIPVILDNKITLMHLIAADTHPCC